MIGVIERIKNNVLLKCSNLNDEVIAKDLNDGLDKGIYQFAEGLINILDDINIGITEEDLRIDAEKLIKVPIVKKIKRKLFIDSLALQITNDTFIEDYVNKDISLEKLTKTYVKELEKNKKSNQLNMTEDIKLTEIIKELQLYVEQHVISKVSENEFLVNAINSQVKRTKEELEDFLQKMINELDLKYLDILINEFKNELQEEIEEGEDNMNDEIKTVDVSDLTEQENDSNLISKFSKYDDMTLFNKMILSLNTKEEKLTRCEEKLAQKQKQIEELLSETNKTIEANIERENKLSQRKLDLSSKEKNLNARLSEAEVIFLNMKPLIKGLNSIKAQEIGGNINE